MFPTPQRHVGQERPACPRSHSPASSVLPQRDSENTRKRQGASPRIHRDQRTSQAVLLPHGQQGPWLPRQRVAALPPRPTPRAQLMSEPTGQDCPAKGHSGSSHRFFCSYFTLRSKMWVKYSGSIVLDIFPFCPPLINILCQNNPPEWFSGRE